MDFQHSTQVSASSKSDDDGNLCPLSLSLRSSVYLHRLSSEDFHVNTLLIQLSCFTIWLRRMLLLRLMKEWEIVLNRWKGQNQQTKPRCGLSHILEFLHRVFVRSQLLSDRNHDPSPDETKHKEKRNNRLVEKATSHVYHKVNGVVQWRCEGLIHD